MEKAVFSDYSVIAHRSGSQFPLAKMSLLKSDMRFLM